MEWDGKIYDGAKCHLHWVDAAGVAQEPFAPGTLEVYVEGETCALCPPEPKRTALVTVTGITRHADSKGDV